MNDLISYAPMIGRIMVGFVFFYSSFCNIAYRSIKIETLIEKRLPKPAWVLAIGIIWQFIFGLMVMLDFYTVWSAAALILFTFLSATLYHDFWNAKSAADWRMRMQGLTNNIGIVGGLLLVIFIAWPNG